MAPRHRSQAKILVVRVLFNPAREVQRTRPLLHRTYARERRSLPLHPRRGAGAAPGYPEDTLPGTKGWAESRCGRSCFTLNKLLRSQAGFVPRPAGTRPLCPGTAALPRPARPSALGLSSRPIQQHLCSFQETRTARGRSHCHPPPCPGRRPILRCFFKR